ncbi:hypothetical protein ACIGNX_01335 [Actinosynnema sp. NPDC053489]|uniref:hypothetical protein n=1 Tax=Actinosynnema sp. NPDC053489 TaxID=3363916 RepID=UPI0037CC6425
MIKSLRIAAAVLMTVVSTSALLVLGPPGTASAGVLDVTCTPPGSETTTYTPPLTTAPQAVTISSSTQYGPCASLSNPAITSGTRSRTTSDPEQTCLDLLDTGSSTYTITWNTGQTTTISANRTATVVGAALVITFTGTVTSGLFTGSTVVQTNTGPSADVLLCTAGLGTVPGIYAVVTLEITSV